MSRVSFTYAVLKTFLLRKIRKAPKIMGDSEVCDFYAERSVLESRRKLLESAQSFEERLKETAAKILAECPPIRVTRAEISRRDPMLELARRMKAGSFKDAIDQVCESTVEFHRRKLKFIMDSPGGRNIADRELCLLFGFKDRKDLEELKSEIGIYAISKFFRVGAVTIVS